MPNAEEQSQGALHTFSKTPSINLLYIPVAEKTYFFRVPYYGFYP